MTLPKTCHTWQYSSAAGSTLEQTLKLNPTAPVPIPSQSQHLIRILHTALNPVDHKPAEHFLFGRMLPIPALATPGIDFAGIVVTPAIDSALREGTLVFGVAAKSPFAAGALSEYAACEAETTVIVPEDVSAVDASTVGVAGLTALLYPAVRQARRSRPDQRRQRRRGHVRHPDCQGAGVQSDCDLLDAQCRAVSKSRR